MSKHDKPVQEPVACLIGTKGSAFDSPTTKRAYTYAEQPGNVVASRLGFACNAAASQSAGDSIDRGLGLLRELQRQGFGVFDLGAEYAAPPQRPAEPVQEPGLTVDALRVEFECRYRGNLGITRVGGGAYLSPAIETEWQQFVRKYTSPPQRKPLTDEEIHDCWQQRHRDKTTERRLITRAIEQAHGIKE